MYNDPDAVCNTHNKQVVWFCIHPMCHKLKPLCYDCHKNHIKYHQEKKMAGEPELKEEQIFKTMKEVQNDVRQQLIQIKDMMEQLEDKAFAEINMVCDPETNIDSIIKELEEIKDNVNKEMDEFIEKLKEQFEKPIKDKMVKIYQEIQIKKENVQSILEDCEGFESIKKTLLSDLLFQSNIQRQKLNDLINQRKNIKFEGVIDDDVALRFQGTFKRELDNLIIYPDHQSDIQEIMAIQKIKIQNPHQITIHNTYEAKKQYVLYNQNIINANLYGSGQASNSQQMPTIFQQSNTNLFTWAQNIHNSIFYFEVGSKNLHYFDEELQMFKKQEIEMDFTFCKDHQTIIGPDGNIYILGGYNEDIDGENWDKYKEIHQINVNVAEKPFINKQADLRLESIRKFFGLCCVKNNIYIVGGFNYQTGTMRTAEKITFELKIGGNNNTNKINPQINNNNNVNQTNTNNQTNGIEMNQQINVNQVNNYNQQNGAGNSINNNRRKQENVQELYFSKRVSAMSLLNTKCSHLCLSSFRDRYIFKFGGIEYDQKILDSRSKRKMSNYIEIYSIDLDQWDQVDISSETIMANLYFASAAQINEHYIFVFGGKDEYTRDTKQSYLLKISEDLSDNQGDGGCEKNLSLELDMSSMNLPFNTFFNQNCIVVKNSILARYSVSQKPPEDHKQLLTQHSNQQDIEQQGVIQFKNNVWRKLI